VSFVQVLKNIRFILMAGLLLRFSYHFFTVTFFFIIYYNWFIFVGNYFFGSWIKLNFICAIRYLTYIRCIAEVFVFVLVIWFFLIINNRGLRLLLLLVWLFVESFFLFEIVGFMNFLYYFWVFALNLENFSLQFNELLIYMSYFSLLFVWKFLFLK
jgi:hypothetical protein